MSLPFGAAGVKRVTFNVTVLMRAVTFHSLRFNQQEAGDGDDAMTMTRH